MYGFIPYSDRDVPVNSFEMNCIQDPKLGNAPRRGGGRVGGRGFERLLGNRIESIRMQRTGHSTANEWPVSRSCRFRLMPRSTAQRCNLATPAKASEQKSMGVRTLFFFGIFFSPIFFSPLQICGIARWRPAAAAAEATTTTAVYEKKINTADSERSGDATNQKGRRGGTWSRKVSRCQSSGRRADSEIVDWSPPAPPQKKGRTMTSF